jgi:hydroxymethylpyrimidine kinase/phosphomethylpyrimidine kinase
MIPNVLSIAGSDPSGGAGIQADLKTFAALRCHGMAVITALTAQNTRGVTAVHTPPADFIAAQIDAIFSDVSVAAVKIGMLANGAIVRAVSERLAVHRPPFVVLDPVLVATSGDSLGAPDVVDAMLTELLPRVDLVTPNAPEAARLTGLREPTNADGLHALAQGLRAKGARAVLVKGGHLEGERAEDVLFAGASHHVYTAPRVATRNTHGTGCTLSSAIAACVAHGTGLPEAVGVAKNYLTGALRASDALAVGSGHGPVNHFWEMWIAPG